MKHNDDKSTKKANNHKMHCERSKRAKAQRKVKETNKKTVLNSVTELQRCRRRVNKSSPTEMDVLSIYTNISKLSAVERYLNMLYRPFTCFVSTGCDFNLSELDCALTGTSYEPEKHAALQIRLSSPTCNIRVYENGNICCQGYSYNSAALGVQRFITTMEQLGAKPLFRNPRFNVVNATFSMPFRINLRMLYDEYIDECEYDPQTRPYLIFKIRSSNIRLAVFPTGFVYVMLSSQPSYTQKAIAFIIPILFRHRASGIIGLANLSVLCSGDITFKILWENELQKKYQHTVKYSR